jgi:hypothetical protein
VALLAVVEIGLLVCLTLRGWRHIQNLCGFSTPTTVVQYFIMTLYNNKAHDCFFIPIQTNNVIQEENCARAHCDYIYFCYPLDLIHTEIILFSGVSLCTSCLLFRFFRLRETSHPIY